MKTIVIIGAGRLGSALGKMIKTSGANVNLWDVVPGIVKKQKLLQEIIPNADVLFLCVNSWHVRDAAKLLRPHLNKKTIIVSPSKGIEQETRYTIDELLRDAFGSAQPIALLSGPMLAHELAQGEFGAALIATKRPADFKAVAALFKKSPLRLEHAHDLRAVALAGALKNAYALALGIADALGLGQNAKGFLAARAVAEMHDIIRLRSPKSDALKITLGPAGLGDLIATGFSPHSTNVSLARDLIHGKKITRMSEGFASLPSLIALLGTHTKQFPILSAVANVIKKKKDAKKMFKNLFTIL